MFKYDPIDPRQCNLQKAQVMLRRIVISLVVIACLLPLTLVVLFIELGGKSAVQFHDGWYNWFYYLVSGGWFGYLLTRLVALILAGLMVQRVWQRSRVAGVALAALLVLSLTIFVWIKSYSPAGIYAAVDAIERDGDAYFVFAGGKVRYVGKEIDGEYARYQKTLDGWTLTTADHFVYKLKFSWFGIWLINVEAPENRLLLGRRIIPFLRPDWMPKWLQ